MAASWDHVDVYTDGSCMGNPGSGGYAALLEYYDGNSKTTHKLLTGGSAHTTNNKMELMACIVALEELKGYKKRITLTTDSQYVKNGINSWIKGWKKNGWLTAKRQPVLNKDLWMRLDSAGVGLVVEWKWVKGHSGHVQNEIVDKEARREAEKYAKYSSGVETKKGAPKRQREMPLTSNKKARQEIPVSKKEEFSFLVGLKPLGARVLLETMGMELQVKGEAHPACRDKPFVTVHLDKGGSIIDVFTMECK